MGQKLMNFQTFDSEKKLDFATFAQSKTIKHNQQFQLIFEEASNTTTTNQTNRI